MTAQEIMRLLHPALTYPNCAVRQARLSQMVQALLQHADEATVRRAETIRAVWVDQDEENAYLLKRAGIPAHPDART